MILVTGATGNVGRQVSAQLLAAGVPVRAVTRDPGAAGLPSGVDVGIDVVRGDLLAPQTLATALHGVDAVFLMWPLASAEPAPALLAALGRHARRVVFLSSAAVRDDLAEQADPIGTLHAGVELAIEQSGMDWTFLRPHSFASNTRRWIPEIRAGDAVSGAYGAAAMTLLHERDIAAVAVHALTEDGHAGRKYVLTGPELLTQIQQVRILGDAIGRPVGWQEISPEAARHQLRTWLPDSVIDTMLDGYATMVTERGEVTSTVEDVTGSPARSFLEWAIDHAGEFD